MVIAGLAAARRLDAATVAAQLKMAVHALALLEGDRPASLVGHLDQLVAATDVGRSSTLTYVTLSPADGMLRMASAGPCSALVVQPGG